MIIYYFTNFDSIDEAVINQLLPFLPQQQQEAIAATKLISRKREIAMGYLMLTYALENEQDSISTQELILDHFPPLTFPLSAFRSPLSAFRSPLSAARSPLSAFRSPLSTFRFAEHGKPYLADHEGIFFNISHCKEAIAVGVSNREIGIDIEGGRRYSEILLQRAFNEEEQATVRQNDNPEMEFARIWTRKEAFFKWTGTGILIEHIKSVEQDAVAAGCSISTQLVTPDRGNPFFLSIAS